MSGAVDPSPKPGLARVRTWLTAAAALRQQVSRPDPLATRLLLLTAVFTGVVAVLILAPSAATFHERWLRDRLQSAELASVGVEALPYSAVEPETGDQLLAIGGVTAVAVSDQGVLRMPTRALIRLDLPTLERPAKATSGRSGSGSCSIFAQPSTKVAGRANMTRALSRASRSGPSPPCPSAPGVSAAEAVTPCSTRCAPSPSR